jgi:hypothetical protein
MTMGVIDQLVQQFNSLQQHINTLIATVNGARSKKYQFEKRINELREIRGKMTGSLTHSAEDVRSKQSKTVNELNSGVRKHSHVGELGEMMVSSQEKSFSEDNYGNQMIYLIDAEINRCQQEIEQAAIEERNAKSKLNDARTRQNTVRSRIRQEQAQQQKR